MHEATSAIPVRFKLNGAEQSAEVPAGLPLIDFLRERCGSLGTKLACGRAVCGACTVLIGGLPVASCALFAWQIDEADVVTIEGISAPDGRLHAIQEAFSSRSAFQCGYCTAGMILLAKALLDHNPDPDRATVVEWLSSGICRCTGYALIVEAVLEAGQVMRDRSDAHA
jgi:carbon-monoxide dehydrogenase small subunit